MKNDRPKGKLLIIGGAEDIGDRKGLPELNTNFEHFELLSELLHPERNPDHQIQVITTASGIPHEVGKRYKKAFQREGIENVGLLHLVNREQAKSLSVLKKIENANAVYFTGGDQFRLTTVLGSSDLMNLITEKYYHDKDFIVGGTSAGAMALSTIMIYRGDSTKGLFKGDVKITSGFGLINHCIIDTHFINRGRFARLAEAVITNPSCIGLGLGEDTALIIRKGNEAECRGSGMVVVIDGHGLGYSNIAYIEDGTPVCAENLKVHILTRGNGFLLEERQFVPAKKDIQLEKQLREK